MPTSENKISRALLSMIRRRRTRNSRGNHAVPEGAKPDGQKVKQREATFADFAAVADLRTRLEFGSDTLENWRRFWSTNPALEAARGPIPMGWVLEADGRLVGYLGNIPLLYQYGEKTLVATTASGFVVEPAYRAWSPGMMASFYRQDHVDLFLNTSAIEAVGKIARALRAEPLPQQDYEKVLFWVLDSHAFSKAVLRKLEMNGAVVELGGLGGLVALSADRAFRGKRPRSSAKPLPVSEVALPDVGAEFDALWLKAKQETPRLLANRSAALLRWHFDTPGSKRKVSVLACRSENRLVGYAVLRDHVDTHIGLRVSSLADLFVEADDPRVIESLLVGAYRHAKKNGNHILEVLGFPESVRRICLAGRPYSRSYPACPFYYRAADRALHKELAAEALWYATPFDGDTSLSL